MQSRLSVNQQQVKKNDKNKQDVKIENIPPLLLP